MLFDTHAHYDDEAFDQDREQLLASLPVHGITKVINAGATISSNERTIQLMREYPIVYGAIGIHPEGVKDLNEENYEWLKEQCSLEKAVAVGEIGLDYYWDEPEKELQRYWFRRQLKLAKEVNLPVIIHSREAAKDTIDILQEEWTDAMTGVIHCYSYTKESAEIFLRMGFYFGIGGVITFKNARKLKEAAAYIPMDKILLETDCPYLAPVPNRGRRNSSLNLPWVVQELAAVKGITPQEVEELTMENAHRLFTKVPRSGTER